MTTDRGTLSGFTRTRMARKQRPWRDASLGQSYPKHYPGPESPLARRFRSRMSPA